MEKKILVAIDDSPQSKEVLRYAANMRDHIAPVRFSLAHVQPAISTYITDEAQRKPSARSALDKIMQKNEEISRQILEAAAQRLMSLGVEETQIDQHAYPRNRSVAEDLLAVGSAKTVDAILVGRRGNSVLHRWFTGSVTANLAEGSEVIPIWLVDGDVTSKDILLAADGSTSALRALDHMAFMLSGSPEQRIRLFHVQPRFGDYCKLDIDDAAAQTGASLIDAGDRGCMDDFHAKAVEAMSKNGLDPDRLLLESKPVTGGVARAILSYGRSQKVGTMVIGRRGRGKSNAFGSVSRALVQGIEDQALWLVP